MSRWLDQLSSNPDLLFAPISPEQPCGEWLRYEGTYEQVREARREDDATLPQGVWQSELKRADWSAVETLCGDALLQRSKDLQLASWLLEAWIQLDGFAGAARGIELMRGLCAAFWEGMYPAIGEGMEARLAPIQWVNEKLARRIRMIRLTRPSMEGVPAYSLADWDVALRNPGDASSRPTVTMANFQQSVALTSHDWLVTLNRDVLETMQRIRGFDALIDEKAGKLSPGLLQFRNEVSSAAQLVETMLGGTRGNMPKPSDGPELAPEAGSMLALPNALESQQAELEQSSTAEYVGRIRTRAEAYRLLEEIADFLYHTDPHSPTPYLIRRAVSWGDKHFDELLPELVRDNGELSDIIKLLRIEMPAKGPK